MARAWTIAAVLAVGGATALTADIEVFWDGFEYGDLCAWSNTPPTYVEQEPFDDGGSNDTDSNAELIPTRCVVVEGTIGNPFDPPGQDPPVADIDYYELSLEGPALVKFRVERFGAESSVQPVSDFLYNSSDFGDLGYFPLPLPVEDPVAFEREYYLPENGFPFLDPPVGEAGDTKDIPANNKWWFFIEDLRNYEDPACEKSPCGGELDRYRATISIESIAGPVVPFPYSNETVSYPADNSLLRYRIPDGVANLTLTETILDQLTPFASDLDSRLVLVKKVGTAIQTVAVSDDWDYESGGFPEHTDSRIGSTALTGGPHFVIVDHWAKYIPDPVEFGLTIQFLQPAPSP